MNEYCKNYHEIISAPFIDYNMFELFYFCCSIKISSSSCVEINATVTVLTVQTSMCILHISVVCNLCNVTAILTVIKYTSTYIHKPTYIHTLVLYQTG